ncbi:MAG: hypothetical protein LBS84_08005 [Clostridiales bacterium]|nr:hypothetical protein [Clostridiales bacterium]
MLRYLNAKDVLPPELLAEIQEYAAGTTLYIPRREEKRIHWGQLTGVREQIHKRNRVIADHYKNGVTVNQLMDEFCLSEASIKKIIYAK